MTGDLLDDRPGRRRVPRREGAQPDGAGAAAAAAVRPRHRRRQHAERHPVVVFPGHHGGELDGLRLERVDPGGVIAAAIEPRRVVGSLAYFATEIVEPGVIRHTEGNRISFGEPDGSKSERLPSDRGGADRRRVSVPDHDAIPPRDLGEAARQRRVQPDQRADRRDAGGAGRDIPRCRALVREVMAETEAVAAKLGIELPISIDQRMAGAEKVGAHKTSMLQDLEAGRPMELEAVVGAVVELGERLGVPMPATRAVYACAKMLDASARRRATRSTEQRRRRRERRAVRSCG